LYATELKNGTQFNDQKIIDKLSETYKLAFLKEIKEEGFPDFSDIVKTEFIKVNSIDGIFVVIKEICTYSDDGKSEQNLLIGKSKNGWKMIMPLN